MGSEMCIRDRNKESVGGLMCEHDLRGSLEGCLLYTSDAADDSLRVDLGGRRIIKKKFFSSRKRPTR